MGGPDRHFGHVRTRTASESTWRSDGPVAAWRTWWQKQAHADDAVVRAAADQGFVLAVAQLADLGISRQHARTSVMRGRWAAPAYGVVAPLSLADEAGELTVVRRRHTLRAAAAVLVRADHVISGRSAAILHGLPTLAVPVRPEVTDAEPVSLGRTRGPSHVHGAELFYDEVTNWFGAPVTTVARTLADIARHDRRDAIMAVDAALRERAVTIAAIDSALETARGWPGVRQAREVLSLADPLAESPLESLTRLALHESGFPPPVLQAEIIGYRVDMLFPAARLVLEMDGLEKYTGQELRREKVREHRLRAAGYWVERIMWVDVTRDWPATSARLRRLLRLPA